jgi:hypothetical protein
MLVKACAWLVEDAAPFLQEQPELKSKVAIQLSALEDLQRRVVALMPSLEELSGEFDLESPDDNSPAQR